MTLTLSDLFSAVATSAALVVWGLVVVRAVRDRVDITTLGLVLVMLGFAIGFALVRYGVPAPGLVGFTFAGVLMLALWGRHTSRP